MSGKKQDGSLIRYPKHKYVRISEFSGYRASGYQTLTVYNEISIFKNVDNSLKTLELLGFKEFW
jgi:hypothetical protein